MADGLGDQDREHRPSPEEPRPVPARGADGTGPAGAAGGRPTGHGDPPPVTDEDRHRYGALLDRAAERGLLGPEEYAARLSELATTRTTEEMLAIVTDLPAFAAVGVSRDPAGRRGPERRPSATGLPAPLPPALSLPGLPGGADRRSSARSWVVLLVLVAVLVAALVVLVLVATHLHRAPADVVGRVLGAVSALRP